MKKRVLILLGSSIVAVAVFAFQSHRVLPALGLQDRSDASDGDGASWMPSITTTSASVSGANNPFFKPEPAPPSKVSMDAKPNISNIAATKPTGKVVPTTAAQFDQSIQSELVLIKFGAEWCGPCQMLNRELDQIANVNADVLTVLSIDTDEEQQLAQRYGVSSIPHLVLLRDGEVIGQWTGFKTAAQLQDELHIASKR